MNPIKTGSFIKELRKEKGLTQEQLAEKFNVSRRTVSRWETGRNLPDLDLLIEMADDFSVDLRELLDGERRIEKMNKELEKTVLKAADYSNEAKKKFSRRMHGLFIAGLCASVLYLLLCIADHSDNFLGGFYQGVQLGMMIIGIIITSKHTAKIRAFKSRLWQRMKGSQQP